MPGHSAKAPPDPLPSGISSQTHTERQYQTKIWNDASQQWETPPPDREIQLRELFGRLTAAERTDYAGKVAAGNANMAIVKSNAATARETGELIDLDSPYTVAMMDLLIAEGVITAARKTEILA